MSRSMNLLSALGLGALALVAAPGCNEAPPAPTVSISPEAPNTLDALVASYDEVEDPNARDSVSYRFNWQVLPVGAPDTDEAWRDMPGLTGARVEGSLTQKGQAWRVSMTASDGIETTLSETSDAVRIVNSPPEVTRVRLSPTQGVDTFGLLTASASATDLDGDEVRIDLTWFINGTPIDHQGDTLSGEQFDKGDVVTVEATATDDEEAGESAISNAVTILNTAPRLEGVTITPEVITEETEVLCEPVGWTDVDGDAPSVAATWLVNGVPVEGVTGALTGEHFDRGDLIRCEGAPDDGDALGNVVVSDVATVQNTPPSMTGATLSSTTPKGSDGLSFTPSGAADLDGDDVSYTADWYVDGELVYSGIELPPGSFIKGQEIYAVVTPTDGTASGEPVTSPSVTAVNSPPVLREISMSPAELYTDSIAFPGVVAEDVDGDPVTYKKVWSVNGTVVPVTGAVLDGATYFDKGDTVQVELTPNDGEDDGSTLVSDAYTVLNSTPTTPIVLIDPDQPTPDDDLWCEIVSTSTDADGDTLVADLEWTRNGSAFTETDTLDTDGDYVYAEDTVDGDSFVCTYTVTDGTDTVTATSEVEVLYWRGPREFGTCGGSGRIGPVQSSCDTLYSGTTLDGDVTVVRNGLQEWVVPQDGTYRIEAYGAAGGAGQYGTYDGHKGARVRGDFDLEEGDKLLILVGQAGDTGTSSYNTGGGGGTFVMTPDGTVLLAAGGGGGNGYNYNSPQSICGGQAGSSPTRNTSTLSSGSCSTVSVTAGSGGSYYERLSGTTVYTYGSGGAGISGNGSQYRDTCLSVPQAINHSTNPGIGGEGRYGASGGFGGGGCGGYSYEYSSGSFYKSSTYGSGGGGGYSGGYSGYYHGGGGSSYNAGSNTSSSTATNDGAGKVTLDLME